MVPVVLVVLQIPSSNTRGTFDTCGTFCYNTCMITHTDFAKLDLRIGKIKSIEKIENTTKLYKILVDIGSPEPIQIISGLAESYSIEDLTGKNIVVLANLEPKMVKGIESQGMLLAAVDENKNISLLVPDKEISPGNKNLLKFYEASSNYGW